MNPSCNCQDNITIGRIIDIDREARHFTAISDRDIASMIRFNVPQNTPVFDPFGRRVPFARLAPGMRVEVKHASFMTMSIPPQTTAFLIKILR